jgi:hypothetical protein
LALEDIITIEIWHFFSFYYAVAFHEYYWHIPPCSPTLLLYQTLLFNSCIAILKDTFFFILKLFLLYYCWVTEHYIFSFLLFLSYYSTYYIIIIYMTLSSILFFHAFYWEFFISRSIVSYCRHYCLHIRSDIQRYILLLHYYYVAFSSAHFPFIIRDASYIRYYYCLHRLRLAEYARIATKHILPHRRRSTGCRDITYEQRNIDITPRHCHRLVHFDRFRLFPSSLLSRRWRRIEEIFRRQCRWYVTCSRRHDITSPVVTRITLRPLLWHTPTWAFSFLFFFLSFLFMN